MAERSVRLIPKKTSVAGRVPTGTTGDESSYIRQGELALNTTDKKLFSFDGTDIFEIGEDSYLNQTGGTINGSVDVTGNLTANTFYSGGTELSELFGDNTYITAITFSNDVITLKRNDNVELSASTLETETKELFIGIDYGNTLDSAEISYISDTGVSLFGYQPKSFFSEKVTISGFNFIVPNDYISGGTFILKYMTEASTSNFVFIVNITSIDTGNDFSTVTDSNLKQTLSCSSSDWVLKESSEYSGTTATFSKGKNVAVRVKRDTAETNDTYNDYVYLWGIIFKYTGKK